MQSHPLARRAPPLLSGTWGAVEGTGKWARGQQAPPAYAKGLSPRLGDQCGSWASGGWPGPVWEATRNWLSALSGAELSNEDGRNFCGRRVSFPSLMVCKQRRGCSSGYLGL